ncbi:MAG: reverse transcriptase family protein, partial [Patescibacteria group bacterium]
MRKKKGEGKRNLPQAFLDLDVGLDHVFCELLRVDVAEWNATKALWESGNAWRIREIPKKSGKRVLHIPSDPLKRMQRGILEQVLRTFPVHRCVHGAHPKTSVVTNARVHAGFGQAFYLLDLKNAFPSVKRERVSNYLLPKLIERICEMTDENEKDAKKIACAILELLHVDDVLPQGFPTSPAVLNLVALPLDREISRLLKETSIGYEFRYTRFVDDLTISTNRADIPSELRDAIKKV